MRLNYFSFRVLLPLLLCQTAQPQEVRVLTQTTGEGFVTVLENQYQATLTAALVKVSARQGKKLRFESFAYLDSQVNNGRDMSLPQGQSRRVALLPPEYATKYDVTATLEAALFGNGDVIGTEYGRAVLLGRRSELLASIGRLEVLLQAAQQSSWRKAELVSRLDQALESELIEARTSLAGSAVSQMRLLPFQQARQHFASAPDSCALPCVSNAVDIMRGFLNRWKASIRGTQP